MDELSAYRSRIGLYAYTAYKKSFQGRKPKLRQRKPEPVTKQTSKRRTTTEVTVEPERKHCTLALVLLLVSVACSIERYGFRPEISYLTSVDWLTGNGYMPEISYLTSVHWLTGNDTLSSGYGCHYPGNCYYRSAVSSKQDLQSVPVIGITGMISLDSFTSDYIQNHHNSSLMYTEFFSFNYTVLNYRDITSPVCKKPVCTINFCDIYTVLNFRKITSPVSEEPVCAVNSCDNYTVLNYRDITSPVSEEPVGTVNSCGNYTVLNYRDITSLVSEEPVCTINSCDNYTVLNYRDITSPVSEEPVYTIDFCDNYTVLNFRKITSPVSEESVYTIDFCDNYTVLNYRDITLPVSEEPVYTIDFCDNYTVLNYRNMTSPVSGEPVYTINSCDNYAVLNYRNMTSPLSGEPVYTINSCDNYAVLNYRDITSLVSEEPICTVNYRNITSPVSEEPVCTVNSCDNYIVLNYRDITSPMSEEPVHTINSCDNYTVLNYRDITSPVSEEPVCTINSCDKYTVLNYRDITSTVCGEPVCTIKSCDKYTVLNYRDISSPVCGELVCAVNSVAGTCSYLLGNSGCHMYNGNPGNRAGEAWLTPETLRLIKKHVDESVGYIKTTTSRGNAWATGFRVGDCQMMTAYHVFRQKIDDILVELVMELERRLPEENFQELCRRLDVRTEKDNTESFATAVKRVLRRFLKDKATNTSLLLQQLEGLINTEQFISEFENNWKQNCVVDFTNNRRYAVDWKVEFGDEDNDIIIVKLLAEAGHTFPRAMLLDENYMDHEDIHVIRYIHDDNPKVIMDQDTQEFRDDTELQRSVEAAVQWWKTKFPDEPENFFSDRYNDCRKSYDEETGHVVLRASKSFTHGASGSPIVYSFNSTGQPIVGMIFQRGHPEFYYRAQVSISEEDRRFKDLQVDSKAFFEGGTTMKKAAQLLDKYRKHELKHNIFSLPENIEVHVVNLDDIVTQTSNMEDLKRKQMNFLIGNKGAHIYNGNNSYQCPNCNKTYKTRAGLQRHSCNTCTKCLKNFSSHQRLQLHKCKPQEEKGSAFKCKDCNANYTTYNRLANHKCKFCKECLQVFSSYQKRQQHICKSRIGHQPLCNQDISKVEKKTYEQNNKKATSDNNVRNCITKQQSLGNSHKDTTLDNVTKLKTEQTPLRISNKITVLDNVAKGKTEQMSKCHEDTIPHTVTNLKMEQNTVPDNITKLKTEQNPSRNSHKDPTSDHQTYHYKPIDCTWQMKTCSDLKLPVYAASMPLFSLDDHLEIGRPTDIKKIKGDGNCFFRALSYVLTGSEAFYPEIRSKIVEHILMPNSSIATLLPTNVSPRTYIQNSRMANDRVWASQIEMFAASHLFKTDIYTYSTYGTSMRWLKISGKLLQPSLITSSQCIYLQHTNGNHYDVVTSVNYLMEDDQIAENEKMENKKRLDRKCYLKEYKRKQRSESSFSQNEQQRKREMRSNPQYCKQEQIRNRKRRENPIHREVEAALNRKRRQNPEFAKFESELNKKRRSNANYVKYEQELNVKRRQDPEFAEFEAKLNRKRRSDFNYVKYEQELNVKRRQDPEFAEFEAKLNRKRRSDFNYVKYEQELNVKRRQDPEFAEFEAKLNRKRRSDPNYVKYEQELNVKRRQDPEFAEFEAKLNSKRRSDPNYAQQETIKKQQLRKQHSYCEKERHHKATRRSDPVYRHQERLADNIHKQNNSEFHQTNDMKELINIFRASVSSACDFVCTSCDQLWFKESVVGISRIKNVKEPLYSQCVRGKLSQDGKEYLCHTCAAALLKGKLPPLSIHNKLDFPIKPEVMEINALEEKLVAPVSTFFQMRELPSGGQLGIQGNVVNVPADHLSTVKSLPRHLPESQTIPVKLKRRLRYKSHVMFQNIRPLRCIAATKYLLSKQSWLSSHIENLHETEWNVFLENNDLVQSEEGPVSESIKQTTHNKESKDDSEWSEEDEDNEQHHDCDGIYDTMLYPENIDSQRKILTFAPSEGNLPISTFNETVEELSFPSIFCGEKRATNIERSVPVKYSEICKSELRRDDRRCASNITNIFFKTKKIQMKQIQDKVWLSLRRIKTKGKRITAGELKQEKNIDHLVKLDDGYRIFRTLRGSPPYWESAKKDLFAMISQLGLPTWFISLSSAETRWTPLLQSLGNIIDKRNYSTDDIKNMTWHDKCRLVRSDPVTTARYFDYKIHKFFNSFLKNPLSPLGKIKEFFYRVEFQHRGSPHIHALIWVEDAPVLNDDNHKDVENFVAKFITTDRKVPIDSTQEDLVKLQFHKHTHTCRKKATRKCRFNFPLPPLRKTTVLEPLSVDVSVEEKKNHKQNFDTIQKELYGKTSYDCDFDEFLETLNMTEQQYILALRCSLKDTKIFLKRDPNSVRINGYNDDVLQAWKANMDIQFVTNAYACVMYIVNYVSKGQRGMSNLLRRACDEAKRGNCNIREQVRRIGNKFLKHVEISAQEAVYITLQLKLKNSNCGHVFINTSPMDERPFIIKSQEELEKLPDDSTNIQCSNIIIRYSKRPKMVENMCLADFAAWYDLRCTKKKTEQSLEQDLPETDLEDNQEDVPYEIDEFEPQNHPQTLHYRGGTVLRRRRHKKIIRYVKYSKQKDPENYYREQLLLFIPWRHEEKIIDDCNSYEEKYNQVVETIDENRSHYTHHMAEIEEAERQVELEMDKEAFDDIAPSTQHLDDQDEAEAEQQHEIYGENTFTEYDIGKDLKCAGTDVEEELIQNRLADSEFRNLAQQLNEKQKEFFYHVLKKAKSTDDQFMLFLSGGAGVGKTRLTKCLFQALIRYYNTNQGENPDQKSVLLTAPTGKAAYLIGGVTLHTAFLIPANQGFNYKPLKSDSLNTLRLSMENLKVVIIDEISMCGSKLFCFINQRLQEVMGTSKPFGGISVLAIGDLFQLKPVMDSWIFQQPTGNSTEVLSENLWKDRFFFFELTTIMRQRDDILFAQILNRLREGEQSNLDIAYLNKRVISPTSPNYPINATHLLYYNKDVDSFNNKLFYSSQEQKATIPCFDIVIGDVSNEVKNEIKLKTQETSMGLSKVCAVAVGMRCELTVNVDIHDGLVNGASGVAMNLECVGNKVEKIWMQFDDKDVGKKLRFECSKKSNLLNSLTPIKKITREFTVGKYRSVKVARTQFPLRLAAAKTVYRAQGDTLNQTVVGLPDKKCCHMHYVSLSRTQKVEDLFLLGTINKNNITVSCPVKEEMKRLRQTRSLSLCYVPLYTLLNMIKICFHNCQSLTLHIEDIRADSSFTSSDIIMLAETRLCQNDDNQTIHIPGFQLHRNDFDNRKSSYGSAVYFKNTLKLYAKNCNFDTVEISLLQMDFIYVASVYARPKESERKLINALSLLMEQLNRCMPVVILGDFNSNVQDKTNGKSKALLRFMESFGFRQIIKDYTTDSRTTIDLIFTNIKTDFKCGTLESYYSYHKPIWFALEQ